MNIQLAHRDIKTLEAGDDILCFYMIKTFDVKQTAAGAKYINLTLGDATGEINAKFWDAPEPLVSELCIGAVVRVMAKVIEYQGNLQMKVEKIRLARQEDNVNAAEFVPVAPYAPEEMYAYLWDTAQAFQNESLRKITTTILKDNAEKLVYYPAAKRNHHAIRSGLLYHTSTMLKTAHKVCEIYDFLNREMLFAGVILHDMAKIDEMISSELGIVEDYSVEGNLIGHLVKGAMNISRVGEQVGADPEIVMLLSHMILAHHDKPEYGSPKFPCTAEAEMLHHLDMIDARMFDFRKMTEELEPGTFSDKVWSLDGRQIYKTKG